jgi:hypothetical protein
LPILQDTPPPGGFPAIRIDRRLPSTGPTGVTIFAVGAAVSAYGYYKVRRLLAVAGPAVALCVAFPASRFLTHLPAASAAAKPRAAPQTSGAGIPP